MFKVSLWEGVIVLSYIGLIIILLILRVSFLSKVVMK